MTWPQPDFAGFEESCKHANDEKHPSTAVVAEEIEGYVGDLLGFANVAECSAQGDVVDVVPGEVGQRPLLAPPGDATVDKVRIDSEGHIWFSPRDSITPGLYPSKSPSACRIMSRATSRPLAVFRSTAMDRRPRSTGEETSCSSASMRSILITSAPRSDKTIPANGTGPMPANSTSVTPDSGPLISRPAKCPDIVRETLRDCGRRGIVHLSKVVAYVFDGGSAFRPFAPNRIPSR